ncbi:amyloid-beta A4 precursor protein-binding family B member 3 isoform X6 [Falco rusticolus]|uniref:amyloid-beta A4 precursor protein-binding family B member 3 isoform X6 n=1 Tax=Falco rusticolus TaxID=120794 RepID=UPI00188671D8|nr:amyloid-beta A4 precursor protein-binding family B member 3 isoform X6 [Falco rusticolus]
MCQRAQHSGSTLHTPLAQEGTWRLMERRHSREWTARPLWQSTWQRTGPFPAPWLRCPKGPHCPGREMTSSTAQSLAPSALLCVCWARWRSPRRTWHLARAASLSITVSSSSPTARARALGRTRVRDRDFAFVASDKDTCVLKCHVFHCNVPAKGIAKALHEMCSKIVAERAVASSRLPCATTLEPVSTEDLPLQVDILEAVRQSMQTYKALYIGSLPVPRAMGMDVLNKAIEKLTRGPGREHWMPSLIHVSDTAMRVHPAQEDEEAAHIWECQVRYVTFLGVGRDAHTFALIVDTGRCFQCTAFWCEPDAGTISEAVQAACMVSGSRNPPNSPALWDTCGRRRRQGLGTEEGKAEGLSGMPNPGGRQGREGADPSEPHPTPRHTQPPSDATLRPRLVVCGPAVVSPCSSTPRPRPVPRVPTGAVPEVPGGRCTG